jgi:hypothetical protein
MTQDAIRPVTYYFMPPIEFKSDAATEGCYGDGGLHN